MIVIGLTGQTGAGKSTLSDFAGNLGLAVVAADIVAREAFLPGTDCLKKAAEAFGRDIVDENGGLIRPLLAERAFSSPEATERLNRISHPWIIERCRCLLEEYRHAGYPAAVLDASQLYESSGEGLCDFVIAVTASPDVRLARIMQRDGISREKALLRMNAQQPEEYYTKRAEYVLDGGLTVPEVQEAFRRILISRSITSIQETEEQL